MDNSKREMEAYTRGRINATKECAAGPWVEGPPPKELEDGQSVLVTRCGGMAPVVIYYCELKRTWLTIPAANPVMECHITRHAKLQGVEGDS